jgi:putative ABC transport system permease protein
MGEAMRNSSDDIRRIARVDDAERELDDELHFHFDTLRRELEAAGWSPAAAAAETVRRFGDEARHRTALMREDRRGARRRRRRELVGAVAEGVRYGARRMRRSPGLSFGVVAAFALGLGANVVMAGALDRLLLRAPPHIRDAASVRLLAVETYAAFRGERFASPVRSYPELTDFADARALAAVAGQNFSVRAATVGRGAEAWRLKLLPVTGNWFGVLGVAMAAGRPLLPSDDVAGAAPVLVISDGLARARYAGAANALGQRIDLGDGVRTIVGVAPRGFTGVKLERVDAWVPLAPWRTGVAGTTWMQSRQTYWLEIVARVAPGASIAAAESELTARLRSVRAAEIAAGRFDAEGRVLLASLIPGESPLAPSEVRVARWLGAVSLIVLLVACINIANLLLAREARGRRDLGIRLALGVSRGRLATNVVSEVLMLALLGAAAALVLAGLLATAFTRLLVPDGAATGALPTPRLLAFTVAIAAASALLVAVLPAVQSLRRDVLHALRASAGGISRGTARLRAGLVIAQVTLSAVLLVGAGLFVRSFASARSSDLGVDLTDTWYATLVLEESADSEGDDLRLYDRAVEALRGVPGVRAAGASSTYPFYQQHGARLRAEGWDSVPGRTLVHTVAGDYFAALGLDVVRGRALDARDRTGASFAAVVNRRMAETLWPDGALGRCLHIGDAPAPCTQVVGIVEDVRVGGLGTDAPMQYYVAAAQQTPADAVFALLFRADGAALAFAEEVQRALASADARVRTATVEPVASILDAQMRPWRLGAILFTAFGGLALLVAVLGLYGVIAFDVTQRLREIGLRAALGASPGHLLGLILQRAVALAVAGLFVGVVAALLLAPRLETLLFGVDARDPFTYAVVAAVLLCAAVCAAAAPGARAARTDPNAALRVDV